MKMEVAALVMGIIGLVCNFFGTGTVVGPICSVLAIIFGVIGMKKNTDKRGMAKAGMIVTVKKSPLAQIFPRSNLDIPGQEL